MPAAAQSASAPLKNAQGEPVGSVNLTQTPHGVLINVSVKGLPPGEHAFHVHAVGKCEPPFTSAGGHFNPGGKKHGLIGAGRPPRRRHAEPRTSRKAATSTVESRSTRDITLDKGKPNSVFDGDGSAVGDPRRQRTTTRATRPATPARASPAG